MATSSNVSTVDDLPELDGNFTDEIYYSRGPSYERIFLELFTFVGLLSIVANGFLIFVILKFKKLRQDSSNVIFLHINILQAVYLLAAPLTVRAVMLFTYDTISMVVFCSLYQIEFNAIFAIIWMLFLLVCDWYLKLYFPDTYTKFCRVLKFFICAVYVICICTCSATVPICFNNYMFIFTYFAMSVAVGIFVIFLIVINIIHVFKKRRLTNNIPRSGYSGLALVNIFFLFWTPLLLLIVLHCFVYFRTPVLLIIACILGFLSPLFNLFYLYWFDDNFNIFLRQVFTCQCNKYQNENLEDQSVTYNDQIGVKISENQIRVVP